jgi:hypothetical protein
LISKFCSGRDFVPSSLHIPVGIVVLAMV